MMGRLEKIISFVTSSLTVLAPKRHEIFSFTAKVLLLPPTIPGKASNCLPEATFMRTFRLIWVVIVHRTVIVSPHGHIFLSLAIFVRGLEGSDAPALQSSHFPKATVLEDVSLSVNPEVHFTNLSRAEPNTLLRSDLVRIGLNKDASKRVGTAADDRFASVCKSGIQISTGYTFRLSEKGTTRCFGHGRRDSIRWNYSRLGVNKVDPLAWCRWTGDDRKGRSNIDRNRNASRLRAGRIESAILKSTSDILRHRRGSPNTITRR
jgi:hypothetical protein